MRFINQKGFGLAEVLIIVVVVGALGGVGTYVYKKRQVENPKPQTITNFDECAAAGNPIMESYPEQCTANGQTFVKQTSEDVYNDGFNQKLVSGQRGFSIIIPDGWTGISSAKDSDFILMPGEKQPEIKLGTKPQIEEVESFGSDGPVVFSVHLTKDNAYVPNVKPENVTFKLAGEPVEGKKYLVKYEQDTLNDGIGGRLDGDRDYYYIFKLENGKTLSISYSIYGSDPRNLVASIEQVIGTIQIN